MSKSNTLTKEALGSVHYISPEQAKGGYTDNRSDLYSLSVVMYEMMAGRPPYDGESPVSVAIQHINGGAPMPSTLNPNIPGGLEQIIMKGMALELKDRYGSATEMLKDMDEFRKDPGILFDFPKPSVSQATQQIDLSDLNRRPMTTAERVAQSKGDVVCVSGGDTNRIRLGNGGFSRSTAGAYSARQGGTSGRTATAARRDGRDRSGQRTRQRQEEMEMADHHSRVTTYAIVGCSVVAIVAIVIFLIALSSGAFFQSELVAVPNLVGKVYKDLDTEQTRNFKIEMDKPIYHDAFEKGQIIYQNPTGGSKVAKDATITVVVSLGPEPVVKLMDDLRGQSLQSAMEHLKGQGVNPLAQEEFSETVPEGDVIRTEPTYGTELSPGQTVWVYYSSGPLIKREIMPKVVGVNIEKAEKMLEDLGFDNRTVKWVAGEEPKGEVVYQSVREGTNCDLTEMITLHVSEGPRDQDTTEPTQTEPPETEPPETEPSRTEPPETEPATEPQEPRTRLVSFKMPTDRSKPYVLSIYLNGKEVVEAREISPTTPYIVVELTGTGMQTYELRINGEFYRTETVDFNAYN
jgi:serine/threonine-protein kinase